MKIDKIIYLLIFFTLIGCDYNPIYKKGKNLNYEVSSVIFEGDKYINRKIYSVIQPEQNKKTDNQYILKLKSFKSTSIVAKNSSGSATVYNTKIDVFFSLIDKNDENKVIKSNNFTSSFSYNNMKNKFDLSQYKKTVENNMIDSLIEEITIFINS